jgi:putative flippase GtrA
MIASVIQRLLSGLDRAVGVAARFGIPTEFVRFGVVGVLGFCWDTATVYTMRPFVGIYGAGVAGFLVAATANWGLNRLWTFRGRAHEAAHQQWLKFIGANAIGFIVNRGLFFTLVSVSRLCFEQPILAIAAGATAGLTFNYFLSKRFVFS